MKLSKIISEMKPEIDGYFITSINELIKGKNYWVFDPMHAEDFVLCEYKGFIQPGYMVYDSGFVFEAIDDTYDVSYNGMDGESPIVVSFSDEKWLLEAIRNKEIVPGNRKKPNIDISEQSMKPITKIVKNDLDNDLGTGSVEWKVSYVPDFNGLINYLDKLIKKYRDTIKRNHLEHDADILKNFDYLKIVRKELILLVKEKYPELMDKLKKENIFTEIKPQINNHELSNDNFEKFLIKYKSEIIENIIKKHKRDWFTFIDSFKNSDFKLSKNSSENIKILFLSIVNGGYMFFSPTEPLTTREWSNPWFKYNFKGVTVWVNIYNY